jgi:hypothetical protein
MPLRKIRNPRNFDRCRVCNHSYLSHTDFKNIPSKCQYIVDGNCKCVEFLPQDNLEFLEYKYAKRK